MPSDSRVHSDVSQRVKKKVTLRHSLDGEPGCSRYPLEESSQESAAASSFRDGQSVKETCPESPALSVVMHSPVLTSSEQNTPEQTTGDSVAVDVQEDDDPQIELQFDDTPQNTSGTSCESSAIKEDESDRGEEAS